MKYFFKIIVLILLFWSCEDRHQESKYPAYIPDNRNFIEYDYQLVKDYFGESFIDSLYQDMNQTLQEEIPKLRAIGEHQSDMDETFLDTVLLINSKKDRVLAYWLFLHDPEHPNIYVAIEFLKGYKFNNKWYFHGNGSESYPTNDKTYSYLHKIVMNRADKYLIRDLKTNNIAINETVFDESERAFESQKQTLKEELTHETISQYIVYMYSRMGERCFENQSIFELFEPKDFQFYYYKNSKQLKVICPTRFCNGIPPATCGWVNYSEKYKGNGKRNFLKYQSDYISLKDNYFSYTFKNIKPNGDFIFAMNYPHTKNSIEDSQVKEAFYKFTLNEGKVTFVELMPDLELLKLHYPKDYESKIANHYMQLKQNHGANYGKNQKIKSFVLNK